MQRITFIGKRNRHAKVFTHQCRQIGCLQCEMACSYEYYGVLSHQSLALRFLSFIKLVRKCLIPARNVMRRGVFRLVR